jgi:hypothetical protein
MYFSRESSYQCAPGGLSGSLTPPFSIRSFPPPKSAVASNTWLL